MSVFRTYARYYDLLNSQKDYASEASYVERLLRERCSSVRSILDLGCGTGAHAVHLAASGHEVAGVDVSEEMLRYAQERLHSLPDAVAKNLSLITGDIRSIRMDRTFDAVVSLFHVVSYQTEQSDLRKTFETARAHLGSGGVFLFDCWYGPGVLTDRPEQRTRHFENDDLLVTRVAEPVLHPNRNVVDVNFDINVLEKASGLEEHLEEVHSMRYLFWPEIVDLLEQSGFVEIRSETWMTGTQPGFDTWNLCVLCSAR